MLSSKQSLNFNLNMLKQARQKLFEDFRNEEPDIYAPSFKYEDNEEQLKLAMEKYFFQWLDYHLFFMEKYFEENQTETSLRPEYRSNLVNNLIKLSKQFGSEINSSELFVFLIKEKTEILEEILTIGDRAEDKLKKLAYYHERDKAFFDREIRKISETELKKLKEAKDGLA